MVTHTGREGRSLKDGNEKRVGQSRLEVLPGAACERNDPGQKQPCDLDATKGGVVACCRTDLVPHSQHEQCRNGNETYHTCEATSSEHGKRRDFEKEVLPLNLPEHLESKMTG